MGNCENKAMCATPSEKILIRSITDHESGINCMALSEDASLLATGSDDTTIRLYGAMTESVDCLGVLQNHSSIITALCFVDAYLLSASADKTVCKWDVSTCELLFVVNSHTGTINRILYSVDLDEIVTCSADSTVRTFSFENGDPIATFSGHKRSVTCIVYVPPMWFDGDDAQKLGSGRSGRNRSVFRKGLIVSGSADATLKSWSIRQQCQLSEFTGHKEGVTCLEVDPGRKIVFSGSTDKSIRSWKLVGGQPLRVLSGHEAAITCIVLAKKVLYSGSADLCVRSWAAEFGDCMRIFAGHTRSVNSIFLAQNILFTACGDGMVRAYCTRSGRLLRAFEGHEFSASNVIAANNRMFSVGYDGKLIVWQLDEINECAKAI